MNSDLQTMGWVAAALVTAMVVALIATPVVKSLAFKDPSSEPLVLERLGDEGCTCYKNLRA